MHFINALKAMPDQRKDCFIIMPIADTDGYPAGHFKHVYDNIIKPSCNSAGYEAVRADQVQAANLIHLDILKKLLDAPMAICDLSSRNPNVLFELGIRQAFDKPVVLIQESGTPKIFDIAPLRYLEYSRDMKYHDVLKTQNELKEVLAATADANSDKSNVNSIVKLLALSESAKIPDLKGHKEGLAFEVLQAEMQDLRKMVELSIHLNKNSQNRRTPPERYWNELKYIINNKNLDDATRNNSISQLSLEIDRAIEQCESKRDMDALFELQREIHRAANFKK